MGRASTGLARALAVWVVAIAPALSPSTARADGPLFRFSANVLALDVVGGGAMDDAMVGGGTSIGLDFSSIDILDFGVRARLAVAPLFTSAGVWGGPGWTGAFAVAARLHTPLAVGQVSWAIAVEGGPGMGQFGIRGDYGTGAMGLSLIIQPGLEHVITPRFAMTYAIDLGVLIDLRNRPDAVLQGALVVGMRAG